MKKLMIVTVMLALAGCATVEGMGKDVSAGARAVNNAF